MTNDTPNELSISRLIDAPVAAVWRAFADPQILSRWWCPVPWRAEITEHDLRPGGRSAMVMRGPDGEENAMEGVFLDVVPERRVVFTDAFRSGWIPQGPFMVGFIELTPDGDQTLYRAGARHWSDEACRQHEEMGFAQGWSKVAEQLEGVARDLTAAA